MKRDVEDIIYYSVFCPKYDSEQVWFDLLSNIRQAFFETGKKQKNKVIKDILGKTYRYSYILEDDKPIKWKKMFFDKLLEKSQINLDGSYNVLIFDENKVMLKSIYFDKNHILRKVEYFGKRYKNKPLLTFTFNDNKILTIENDIEQGKSKTYELYPINIDVKNYKLEALDNRFTTLLCKTSSGEISYCTEEQIQAIEKLRKPLELDKEDNIEATNHLDVEKPKEVERSIDMKDDKGLYIEEINKDDGCEDVCSVRNRICPYDKFGYRKTIVTESGKKFFYFGEMQDKNRHGHGKTVSEEGFTMYDGRYANDKKDGFGIFNDKDGDISYVGYFKEDKRDKLGISFNKSKNLIKVESFKEGKKDSLCSEFNDNGNLMYLGELSNGLKNGAGISYIEPMNCFFVGIYKDGEFANKGTIINKQGNVIYSGGIESLEKNGFGTEYNNDGTIKYRGNFLGNCYNGEGKLYLPDGRKIDGNFKNGAIHGIACEYDKFGKKIYEGCFENNHYNGEGRLYLENNHSLKGHFVGGTATGVLTELNLLGETVYVGEYKNGKYSGNGCLYKDGEKIYEGEFRDNEYNGQGTLYELGERVFKGTFVSSIKTGFGEEFIKGNLNYAGYFKDGLYEGIGIAYEDSKPKYVGTFSKGKKDGRINVIHENEVVKECIYNNDELVYAKEYSYPELSLEYYGNIQNNQRNGMGCTFNEYAEKEFEGIFADGCIVNRMNVILNELNYLSECLELNDYGYNKFRFGPEFVIEKQLIGGIYSGRIKNNKPHGKGTILYSDHRYTGEFDNGMPMGSGTIYKNDGVKIKGEFIREYVPNSTVMSFSNDIEYILINNL